MAKQLIQLIIAGGQVNLSLHTQISTQCTYLQVVGKAFSQAVRQEIRLSQEAAKARGNSSQNTAQQAETARYIYFFLSWIFRNFTHNIQDGHDDR